ncbi:MAG: glutamate-cysteine ligase family protein [Myxococcota bacterium]|nr:glutamate-cysteine ligase family protein [Myxococcota bacterium]
MATTVMSRPLSFADNALHELKKRPVAEVATEELCRFFAKGETPKTNWKIGLEMEVFVHHKDSRTPASFEDVKSILETLIDEIPQDWNQDVDPNGQLVGLSYDGQVISLEPGGQFEFATRPYGSTQQLQTELFQFVEALHKVSSTKNMRLLAIGQQPEATVETIPRMPKNRYDIMRSYLPQYGSLALNMMHLTASMQCAVDFSDEANMKDKIRTAAKVSPFLTALTAASPFSNGKPNGYKSFRYEIWRKTDSVRCGIWPEMLDETGLGYERYIEKALDTPAMIFLRKGRFYQAERRPFREYAKTGFDGAQVTVEDFLLHLTSLFPEVRPKTYVEMRGADCLPPNETLAIAAFWRGLLDDSDARGEALQILEKIEFEELIELQAKVAKIGLDADSSAGKVSRIIKKLVGLSLSRLTTDEPEGALSLMPLVNRADREKSLADDMLDVAARSSIVEALELGYINVDS